IEDFQSAISFASTLKNIDSERIGIWGTSLGGRNVLLVAARDKSGKCVVSQVPGMGLTPEMLSYFRSEERRVGHECVSTRCSRGGPTHQKITRTKTSRKA